MELQYQELEHGIRLIKLIGKLDISEMREIESKFIIHCAGSQVQVIVDLSEITAVTSSGAKLLQWAAKEVVSRGGRFVLVNPLPGIEQALEKKGFEDWASTYPDLDTATSFLLIPDARQNPFLAPK